MQHGNLPFLDQRATAERFGGAVPERTKLLPLACMVSSECHALVTMQRPDGRSMSIDIPTHPVIPNSVGMTLSRMYAMPASMAPGRARTVVERAYTVHPLPIRGAPDGAAGNAQPSPRQASTATPRLPSPDSPRARRLLSVSSGSWVRL